MEVRRWKAPPSGYRFREPALRSSASSAAGNGPQGPSFEASLTTRSRPSSRWTSSSGLPGSYGTSPSSEDRNRLIGVLLARGRRQLVARALLPPEPEHADDRGERGRDRALVRPLRVLDGARRGPACLLLRRRLHSQPRQPPEERVSPIEDADRLEPNRLRPRSFRPWPLGGLGIGHRAVSPGGPNVPGC